MKTKIISILCSVALIIAMINTPLLADNVTQNSTPSTSANQVDGEDYTQSEKTMYNGGTTLDTNESTEVYVSQSSTFAAMIPKVIILDGHGGNATYEVYAKGNIGGTENVYIVPQTSFQLNDVKNIKSSLSGNVSQTKTTFSWNDVMNEQKATSIGTILVNGITAGNWIGSFNFNIYLQDTIVPIETITLGDTSLINSETNTIQVAYDKSIIVPIDIYPFNAGTPIQVSSTSPYVEVEVIGDTLVTSVDNNLLNDVSLTTDISVSDEKHTINVKVTLKENAPLTIESKLIIKAKTKTLEVPISVANKIKFEYSGNVQEFVAPMSGNYQLEVYGAQGGGVSLNYGKGGYSKGTIYLNKNDKVYVCIGEKGCLQNGSTGGNGGYNGGGNGGNGGYYVPDKSYCAGGTGGGGATSITMTNRGVLKNFASYRNEVLIVAGGGGGHIAFFGNLSKGGEGGGLSGNNGLDIMAAYADPIGGTQITGYAFGQGGNGRIGTSIGGGSEGTAGGGGGWYGGCARINNGEYTNSCGAGGSGYIGGVTNGTTTSGVNTGNGYAIITIID